MGELEPRQARPTGRFDDRLHAISTQTAIAAEHENFQAIDRLGAGQRIQGARLDSASRQVERCESGQVRRRRKLHYAGMEQRPIEKGAGGFMRAQQTFDLASQVGVAAAGAIEVCVALGGS